MKKAASFCLINSIPEEQLVSIDDGSSQSDSVINESDDTDKLQSMPLLPTKVKSTLFRESARKYKKYVSPAQQIWTNGVSQSLWQNELFTLYCDQLLPVAKQSKAKQRLTRLNPDILELDPSKLYMSLPIELQKYILQLAVVHPLPIQVDPMMQSRKGMTVRPKLDFLFTCRQWYEFGMQQFFRQNMFAMSAALPAKEPHNFLITSYPHEMNSFPMLKLAYLRLRYLKITVRGCSTDVADWAASWYLFRGLKALEGLVLDTRRGDYLEEDDFEGLLTEPYFEVEAPLELLKLIKHCGNLTSLKSVWIGCRNARRAMEWSSRLIKRFQSWDDHLDFEYRNREYWDYRLKRSCTLSW